MGFSIVSVTADADFITWSPAERMEPRTELNRLIWTHHVKLRAGEASDGGSSSGREAPSASEEDLT